MREAFELALDRDGIVQVGMDGEADIGNQWVAPGNAYYAKNVPIPKRDVARAKELLREAGVPNPTFTLVTPTTSDAQKIAQVVQAMAKEAGFDVKLQATEFATSLDMADKGQFEAYVLAWSGRADPDGNLFSFDGCKQPLNYAGYCKPEVDELLNRSRTTLDPAERKKVFEQIAAIVLKDRPVVYLFHRHWLWAHTAKLSGLRMIPDGLVRVQGLRMNLGVGVLNYLVQRLATLVPTLFFVSILIFGLQQLLPGDSGADPRRRGPGSDSDRAPAREAPPR